MLIENFDVVLPRIAGVFDKRLLEIQKVVGRKVQGESLYGY